MEPDIIITKGDNAIMADAKYKMHLYNSKSEKVDVLKESFRHDLHQTLAYSSFEKARNKMAMLVYPCNSYKCIHQKISAPILSASNDVYLIGIPWGECSAEIRANYISIQVHWTIKDKKIVRNRCGCALSLLLMNFVLSNEEDFLEFT